MSWLLVNKVKLTQALRSIDREVKAEQEELTQQTKEELYLSEEEPRRGLLDQVYRSL
jgi:hypothetical protein